MGQFSAPASANQPSGFSVRGASTDCEWFNIFQDVLEDKKFLYSRRVEDVFKT